MYDPRGATYKPTGTPYQSKSPMQSAPGIGSVFSTDAGGPPADNTGSPSSPGVIGGGFGRRQMKGGAQQPGASATSPAMPAMQPTYRGQNPWQTQPVSYMGIPGATQNNPTARPMQRGMGRYNDMAYQGAFGQNHYGNFFDNNAQQPMEEMPGSGTTPVAADTGFAPSDSPFPQAQRDVLNEQHWQRQYGGYGNPHLYQNKGGPY